MVLLPLGAGVTYHDQPSSGWQSFWITFCGPITHVFMLIPLLILYYNLPDLGAFVCVVSEAQLNDLPKRQNLTIIEH